MGDVSNFFEGPEKLLEIWFEPINKDANSNSEGLRRIKRHQWDELLKLVKCTILSELDNGEIAAYVLSESSMFVYPHRFILKTCGTTTLLPAVPALLELAEKEAGLRQVEDVFYSRKNFLRPEQQLAPHQRFEDEVAYLDSRFQNGAAYILGRINGDSWYLYTLDSPRSATTAAQPTADTTLEILMHGLQESSCRVFYKDTEKYPTAKAHTEASGIGAIFSEAQTDEYVFDPCGYSVNGVLKDAYFTIHVTPQDEYSYASFETNVLCTSYTDVINKVLAVFNPGRFSVTVFSNQEAACGHAKRAFDETALTGYRRKDKQLYQFERYSLNFGHFVRKSDQ